MATFQTKPVQIKAIQYTEKIKADFERQDPSSHQVVSYHPEGDHKVALAYYDQVSGTLQMPTYGKKLGQINVQIGAWLIYEDNGKPVRKYMTNQTFQELYQAV